MDKRVALRPCADYSDAALDAAIREAMDLAPPPDLRGKSVLLKVNMLKGAKPDEAVSTHPDFVRAVIRAFRARGASRIVVGDSPGYQSMESAAETCGILEAIRAEDAEAGSFDAAVEAENPDGVLVKRFRLAREWAEADVVVSLPKLKTHALLQYTGALKNLFGLVVGFEKAAFHFRFPKKADFSRMMTDLALCADADYALMDAVVGMEGPGPGNGYPKQIGLVIASANLLALDSVAARIIGYDPWKLGYLSLARSSGRWLGPSDEAEVVGGTLEAARVHGFKLLPDVEDVGFQSHIPAPLRALIRRIMVPRPVFRHDSCVRCAGCVDICPAKALSFGPYPRDAKYGKRIEIDYKAAAVTAATRSAPRTPSGSGGSNGPPRRARRRRPLGRRRLLRGGGPPRRGRLLRYGHHDAHLRSLARRGRGSGPFLLRPGRGEGDRDRRAALREARRPLQGRRPPRGVPRQDHRVLQRRVPLGPHA